MALKRGHRMEDIYKGISDFEQDVVSNAIQMFAYVGETFVNDARLTGSYNDITGNLRSSVGYRIGLNGKSEKENFKLSNDGTVKTKGKSTGEEFSENLVKKDKGIVLVGVAGMNYASEVEARGREVITAASERARIQLNRLIKKL